MRSIFDAENFIEDMDMKRRGKGHSEVQARRGRGFSSLVLARWAIGNKGSRSSGQEGWEGPGRTA